MRPDAAPQISTGYSRLQIALHWVTVGLILWQFVANEAMGQAWRAFRQGTELPLSALVAAHVFAGLALLAIAFWRMILRVTRNAPPAPAGQTAALRAAAAAVHGALYILTVAVAVSGAVAWFGGIATAAEAHEFLKTLLLVLIGLHVAAALWHQFWLRDGLMERMRRPQA
ncbi:MAG: cytochrome b/b6 domain-containing protein [Gemmobacter sp.]|uniref:cytochrome b n=1 Tax=Gemmobacter sp. TaxID=1898957 RepID=UPI001A39DA2B|nr:cytochrome b/b6 domain-containing protein [Gemmobacter sp.]MBL8561306.1 cytochrome b/b6 domain-containing protein [Gemmobacter sp.]